MNMVIEPMSSEYVARVKRLERECKLSPWTEDDYREESNHPNSIFLVARVEEKIVGFVLARLITPSDTSSRVEMDIQNIAVDINYRRTGIATELFKQLFDTLESSEIFESVEIYLEVRKTNEPAICFYQKLGFIKIGERKNFYTQPVEDAILMKKIIPDQPNFTNLK